MLAILSSRQKKIIMAILNNPLGITIQEISDEIGVSRRTVNRDMSSIYEWFEESGVVVERQLSKGLSLHITDDKKTEILQIVNETDIQHNYSKKERTMFIISELLRSKEYLKLAYFAYVLDVSDATISTDLNSVEEWLNNYNLELERKQGYGILIIGTENAKRNALINIMYEVLDVDLLKDALNRQIGIDSDKTVITSRIRLNLLNLIEIEMIEVIEHAILECEMEMNFKLAESSYIALAVHLALSLQRIKNNELVHLDAGILEDLKLYNEYLVATSLIKRLESKMDLVIPEDEIGYVTLHLKGARYKTGLFDSSMLKFNETIISNYKLTSMINKMIKIASEETGYNLNESEVLMVGMVDHLRPALSRLESNLEIRNPLLEKIKEDYAEVYSIAKKASTVITEELNLVLPDSEIGYIAMHIGGAIEQIKNQELEDQTKFNVIVTCISGIGTSMMLAERIKKEFKNINILKVFATTSINDNYLRKNEVDLILSTVHFNNDVVDVLTVNPLLQDNDIKKVTQKLSTLFHKKKSSKDQKQETNFFDDLTTINIYSEAILEILTNLQMVFNIEGNSYEEVVKAISEQITPNDLELYKDFMDREHLGKIRFDNEKVMFLHARSNAVDKLRIGIYRNTKLFTDENNSYDTVLVLVAPIETSGYKLEIMGEISARVVSEDNFLNDLRYLNEAKLYKKIELILQQYFQRILGGM